MFKGVLSYVCPVPALNGDHCNGLDEQSCVNQVDYRPYEEDEIHPAPEKRRMDSS